MKKLIIVLLTVALFTLAISGIVLAESPTETDGHVCIYGVIYEVNCERLPPRATVELYLDGEFLYETVSSLDSEYIVIAEGTGEFKVVVSKEGYRNEEQTLDIAETRMYELNFRADSGLVPMKVDMSYLLKCVNLWIYAGEHGECGLSMSTVLSVINAWLYPSE